MNSLDEMAEALYSVQSLRNLSWQVFDLSAAKGMLDEMATQYDAAGVWPTETPPPAANCVFWDGKFTIMCRHDGETVTASFLEAHMLEEREAEKKNLAIMLLDDAGEGTKFRQNIIKNLGTVGARELFEEAAKAKNEPDYQAPEDSYIIGGAPSGLFSKFVAVYSEFIGFPIARSEPSGLSRPTRRRLQRLGMSIDLRTVSLSPPHYKAQEEPHSPGARKALHFCRGHWRKSAASPSGKTWIAGHWRGDPSLGVVLHNYVATMADVDARSRLIA